MSENKPAPRARNVKERGSSPDVKSTKSGVGAVQSSGHQTAVPYTEQIPPLFRRFLELEEQCKRVNDGKAAIFAEAKRDGLDARALRGAFRLGMRELDQPGALQKHDALNSLTASYLAALRGDAQPGGTRPPNSTETPLRELLSVVQPNSDPRSRSRAREGDADNTDTTEAKASKPDHLGPKSTEARLKSTLEEEPEIPEFLRAKPSVGPTTVDQTVSTRDPIEIPETK